MINNMSKYHYIYIITNKKQGTLYTGITSDLLKRIWQHKNKVVKGFTNKYNLDKLVYYETSEVVDNAITREKQLKNWKRQWKIELIEKENPEWKDLYQEMIGQ